MVLAYGGSWARCTWGYVRISLVSPVLPQSISLETTVVWIRVSWCLVLTNECCTWQQLTIVDDTVFLGALGAQTMPSFVCTADGLRQRGVWG